VLSLLRVMLIIAAFAELAMNPNAVVNIIASRVLEVIIGC